jgi:hypothetical protein
MASARTIPKPLGEEMQYKLRQHILYISAE